MNKAYLLTGGNMGNQKNTGKGLHAHWSILREYRRLIIPL
jgi:hypothetical protein